MLRDVSCRRIQHGEIWPFVYAEAKNMQEGKRGEVGCGDVWAWTAIVALHSLHDNFARIHQSLRVSPAMAAGVRRRLWDVGDIAALLG